MQRVPVFKDREEAAISIAHSIAFLTPEEFMCILCDKKIPNIAMEAHMICSHKFEWGTDSLQQYRLWRDKNYYFTKLV